MRADVTKDRAINLLGKFLDAWLARKDPDPRDVEEANRICYGQPVASRRDGYRHPNAYGHE